MKVRRFNRRAAADFFRIDVYSTGNFEDPSTRWLLITAVAVDLRCVLVELGADRPRQSRK